MHKPVSARRVILWIAAVLIVLLIFGQSVLPETVSREESSWVRDNILAAVFGWFGLQPPSHNTVRKLAHIFEFTVLSALLLLCFRGKLPRSFFAGFTAAFLDESIQLLTGRGALVQDIWIDLIGVACGVLIGFLLHQLINRTKPIRQNHPENREF